MVDVLDFFKRAMENGKLAHGYLFWGGGLEEMKEAAYRLADFLKTSPFDILYITLEEGKKDIAIEQIRKARKHLALSPYNGLYKFAIIDKAETMNLDSANALLKTLEEPQGNTILILITSKPDLLPKTIISRLQDVRFRSVPLSEIYKSFFNKEYINLLQKPLNDVFKVIERISKEGTEIFPLLDCWLFFFRDLLINRSATNQQRDEFIQIIKEIQKTKELISTTNVNKRLALENLFLCINN